MDMIKSCIVGVIGGLGPEATVDFFAKIVSATPARTDQEHLHLIIDNNPRVPNRHDAIRGTGPSPAPHLIASAKRLEAAGADVIVMVCNTAHAFAGAIAASVEVPMLNIIEATCDAAQAAHPGLKRAGVLAASGAIDARLYGDALARRGVEELQADRERFMEIVWRIKAGDKSQAVRDAMRQLAVELVDDGAEVIIAGCTEVPLVLSEADLPCPLINSTDALVERTVAFASAP